MNLNNLENIMNAIVQCQSEDKELSPVQLQEKEVIIQTIKSIEGLNNLDN